MKVLSSIRNAFKGRFGGLKRRGKHSSKRLIAFTVFTTAFVFAIGMICVQRISPLGDGPKEVSSPAFNIVLNDGEDGENAPVAADISSITEPAPAETEVLADEGSVVLALKEDTGKGYLNNCVFLGDSRTVAMVNYGLINDDAALAEIGISHTAFKTNKFINNAGKQYTLKSYLESHQSPVIYIALGVNGINDPSEEHYKSTYTDLIDTVAAQAPDSSIVLMSIGPVNDNGAYRRTVQNSWIEKYNAFLEETAEEKNLFYLNTSEILTGPNGQVKPEYDGGDGLHYSNSGCRAILDYICKHPVPGISDEGEYVVHYVKPDPSRIKVTMDDGSGIDQQKLEELMNMMVENAALAESLQQTPELPAETASPQAETTTPETIPADLYQPAPEPVQEVQEPAPEPVPEEAHVYEEEPEEEHEEPVPEPTEYPEEEEEE